ncbi:hypothetical protein OHS18_42080 [Amycolatopsis sp. NBC_00355]|uniref:hypothetical protein n=1 Tax=Amycolatopsis sp. NBC_00355 TaxID=2975957 RepID=UPI002E270EFB
MVDAIDEIEQEARRKRSWRPARLQVSSPAHSTIEVSGWAKWFPADHVSMDHATGVTVANHCRTIQEEHYHVRRASISMEPLLDMTDSVRSALDKLLKDPQSSGATQDFQDTLRRQLGAHTSPERTRTELPVHRYFDTSVWDTSVVQLGDYSRLNADTHYVIEEMTFKLAELLADNADLVTSFVRTILDPSNTSVANSFLHDTMKMTGHLDDLKMLNQISEEIGDPGTSVRGLFGLVQVEHPTAVAIGVGNKLTTSYSLDLPRLKPDTLLADMESLRASLGITAPGAVDAVHRPGNPSRR